MNWRFQTIHLLYGEGLYLPSSNARRGILRRNASFYYQETSVITVYQLCTDCKSLDQNDEELVLRRIDPAVACSELKTQIQLISIALTVLVLTSLAGCVSPCCILVSEP